MNDDGTVRERTDYGTLSSNDDDSSEKIATERKKPKLNHATWLLIIALSEAIGTFLLVFVLCTGAIPSLTPSPPSHLQVCIIVGITVTVIVQVFAKISGAHINPAVTLAAAIFRQIPLSAAVVYIVSQLIGGILGYGMILIMIPREALYANGSNMNVTHGLCTTVPNPKVTTLQALLAEYAATSILIYVCCSIWDKRNQTQEDLVSIKFGLTITGIAGAFGPISGASINPARTFAPAIFTGVWDRQWIYWLGPLASAAFTAIFYKYIFLKNYGPSGPDQSEIPLNQQNPKVQSREKISGESANL